MEFKAPQNKETFKKVKKLYKTAFPRSERKPIWLLKKNVKSGLTEISAVFDNGEFVGLVITTFYKDIALIEYLAIEKTHRSKGYGGKILTALKEKYNDYRIILEIEDPDAPCSNREERLRRRSFYLQNGMTELDYTVYIFGEVMKILTFSGNITFTEYVETYENTVNKRFAKKIKLKN